jgi:hypothetical protein
MDYEYFDREFDFSLVKGSKKSGNSSRKIKNSRGGGKDKKTKTDCQKNKNQVYSQKYIRQKVSQMSKSHKK